MGEVLALGFDTRTEQELATLVVNSGARFKSVQDLSVAKGWFALRSFDALLVPAAMPIREQQELADLLWRKNPLSLFVTLQLGEGTPAERLAPRLFGAQTLEGGKVYEQLAVLLGRIHPSGGSQVNDLRVLVVEDLDSPRDIICSFVEMLGAQKVHGVNSASAALAVLREPAQAINCVLTDLKMPEIAGEQLIAQIRGDRELRGIPIIVLTAHGTADALILCLKAGASGFLVKPPKKVDLQRELNRARRIIEKRLPPALTTPQEADLLRDLLAEKGIL